MRGDLYLKGYGDPTALEPDYVALAKQVAPSQAMGAVGEASGSWPTGLGIVTDYAQSLGVHGSFCTAISRSVTLSAITAARRPGVTEWNANQA